MTTKRLSAYNFFFQEKVKLKDEEGRGMGMRAIADLWKEMPAEDKAIYQERAQNHNDDLAEQIKSRKLDDLIRRKKPSRVDHVKQMERNDRARSENSSRKKREEIPDSDVSEQEQIRPRRSRRDENNERYPKRDPSGLRNVLDEESEQESEHEPEPVKKPKKKSASH